VTKRGPILLVERDPEGRDLIGGWLENDGYDVLARSRVPDHTQAHRLIRLRKSADKRTLFPPVRD